MVWAASNRLRAQVAQPAEPITLSAWKGRESCNNALTVQPDQDAVAGATHIDTVDNFSTELCPPQEDSLYVCFGVCPPLIGPIIGMFSDRKAKLSLECA